MTVLIGDVKDVGHKPTEGTITVRSAITRTGYETTGVITREVGVYQLENGKFETADLDPGHIIVELNGQGTYDEWRFDLPSSEDPLTLASLVGHVEDYSPTIVGSAQAAAAQAEAASIEAAQAADRADAAAHAAAGDAAQVQQVVADGAAAVRAEFTGLADEAGASENAAAGSAEAAAASAAAAQVSESAAAESAAHAAAAAGTAADDATGAVRAELQGLVDEAGDSAEGARSAASTAAQDTAAALTAQMQGFVEAASGSVTAASGSAEAAAGSEQAAAASAAAAKVSESAAAQSASSAESDRVRAEAAAGQAQGSASAAQESASAAAQSVVDAGSAKSGAEAARDEAVQAASVAKVGAPESGWPMENLSAGVQASLGKADTALQSVPDATAEDKGVVQLAGELGGTADAPTVSAVQSVTPSVIVRRDASAQIFVPSTQDNNNHALSKGYADGRYMQKSAVSQDPGAYTLAQRVSTGALKVGEPTASTHATTKQYVDDAVAKRVLTSDVDYLPTPYKVAQRDSAGHVKTAEPTSATDAATKAYVDGLLNPGWVDYAPVLRDNGQVGPGGATVQAKIRLINGMCEYHFSLTWGSSAKTSSGGFLRAPVPKTPDFNAGKVFTGSGTLFLAGGSLWFQLTPVIQQSTGSYVTFLVPKHGDTSVCGNAQIWDGATRSGTGIPANPGFQWDETGTTLRFTIRYPYV